MCKHTKFLEYPELFPGLNKQGNICDANMMIRISEQDAINLQRYYFAEGVKRGQETERIKTATDVLSLSDKFLLEEFKVVNWATTVKGSEDEKGSREKQGE